MSAFEYSPPQPHGTVWPGVKLTAASGIAVVYGGRTPSRHPPNVRHRGIGLKVKGKNDSWNGLLDKKLHSMRFNHPRGALRIPVMGMPPRELDPEMMDAVRQNEPFEGWFQKGAVFPAQTFLGSGTGFKLTRHSHGGSKANVVMTLPSIEGDPQTYEFETAIPLVDEGYDSTINPKHKNINNLYFIQNLPNELPTFHFWYNPKDPHATRPVKRRELFIRTVIPPRADSLDEKGKVAKQTREPAESEEQLTSRVDALHIPSDEAEAGPSSSTSRRGVKRKAVSRLSSTPIPATKTAKFAKKSSPAAKPRGKGKAKRKATADNNLSEDDFIPDQEELNEPQEVVRRRPANRRARDERWKPSPNDEDDEEELSMKKEKKKKKGKGRVRA